MYGEGFLLVHAIKVNEREMIVNGAELCLEKCKG